MECSCLPGQVSWAVAFQAACSTFPVVESSGLGSPCWEGLPRGSGSRRRPLRPGARRTPRRQWPQPPVLSEGFCRDKASPSAPAHGCSIKHHFNSRENEKSLLEVDVAWCLFLWLTGGISQKGPRSMAETRPLGSSWHCSGLKVFRIDLQALSTLLKL